MNEKHEGQPFSRITEEGKAYLKSLKGTPSSPANECCRECSRWEPALHECSCECHRANLANEWREWKKTLAGYSGRASTENYFAHKKATENLLNQHSAHLVEREHNKMLDWAETCYKRGFTDGFEEGKKDIFKTSGVQELLAVDYTVPQYEFKESDKCRNCRNLHNGSIVKVDDGGKCVFCGRKVGDQAIDIVKDSSQP
jgi:hypothetical protein